MKWIVETARQSTEAEGNDAFEACVAVVKSGRFGCLGRLMSAYPAGQDVTDDDNTYYVSSESACKAAGVWK